MGQHYGYMGRIGHIDLSSETLAEYPWEPWPSYLGGKVGNQRILLDLLAGKVSAFSEENPILFSTGPLVGTGAPASARFDMAAVSPVRDSPVFSNFGGSFGIWLKRAGFDALILTGRCREKRWLEIREDTAAFHDAAPLWGKTTGACQNLLGEYMGGQPFGRLCIGPAGENLVNFATVVAGGHGGGRAGLGAVLGWKNLKAITVTGSREIPLYDPEAAAKINREWHTSLKQAGQNREASEGKNHCTNCPLHCARGDREKNSLPNELGMDAIAAADAVRWAEEQGLETAHLYEDIAYGRGIGKTLARKIPSRKGKGGNRRFVSCGAMAEAFGLPAEAPETEGFCRDLTEAISAAGQCIFTANGLGRTEGELPLVSMLRAVTGRDWTLEKLLRMGQISREQETRLRQLFLEDGP